MTKILEQFYRENQEQLDNEWAEHLSVGEFGSGEDRISITDEMFWEWVDAMHQVENL